MSEAALGQMLALCSAASFAFGNNFISRTSRSGGDKGVMFSVLVTMGMSALLWLAIDGGGVGELNLAATWPGIAWFALAGVLAMFLGRSLLYKSIQSLGVTRSTAVKRLNPFFSVMFAALLLSEPITRLDATGMLAIAAAFGILIRESFLRRGSNLAQGITPASYVFGVGAALVYALSYVARKLGLGVAPSPTFGTLVSAMAGFLCFAAMSVFSVRTRQNVLQIFSRLDRWIVLSAVLVSMGQIFLFAALAFEDVSTVVMIASLEIFISISLSRFLFRNEERLSPQLLVAAGLAMSGVLFVAV